MSLWRLNAYFTESSTIPFLKESTQRLYNGRHGTAQDNSYCYITTWLNDNFHILQIVWCMICFSASGIKTIVNHFLEIQMESVIHSVCLRSVFMKGWGINFTHGQMTQHGFINDGWIKSLTERLPSTQYSTVSTWTTHHYLPLRNVTRRHRPMPFVQCGPIAWCAFPVCVVEIVGIV